MEEVTLAEAQARGVSPKDIVPPEYCTRCEQMSNDGCWHEWSPWWQPFASSEEQEVLKMNIWTSAYKKMVANLPDVNKAVKDMFAAKRSLPLFPEKYEEACYAYGKALAESRRIQVEFGDKARAAGICVGCLDKNGPRHKASSRCESGGRSHCSCDVCY